MQKRPLLLIALCCLTVATSVGCQSAEDSSKKDAGNSEAEHGHSHDHEHSERYESLQAAVKELVEIRDKIRTAMEEDDPDAAHAPLHHVGGLLRDMPDLAADTDLPESEWNEIKGATDKLFDAFGKIDAAFHKKDGDKKGAYEEVKDTIDQELGILEAKLSLLAGNLAVTPDGHGHSDDEESNSSN